MYNKSMYFNTIYNDWTIVKLTDGGGISMTEWPNSDGKRTIIEKKNKKIT